MELDHINSEPVDQLSFANTSVYSMYPDPGFGSSVDPSAYTPFTPTSISGRSTPMSLPAGSFDMGTPFSSEPDTMSYRTAYTPPPTAASKGFTLAVRADGCTEYITGTPAIYGSQEQLVASFPRSLPAIPPSTSPYNHMMELQTADPLFRSRMTASPAVVDLYLAPHSLHSSPLTMAASVPAIAEDEVMPTWATEMDPLPNLFGARENSPAPLLRPLNSGFRYPMYQQGAMSSHHRVGKRLGYPGPRPTNAPMHRSQPRSPRQGVKKGKSICKDNDFVQLDNGIEYEYTRVSEGEFKCEVKGCHKKFARKEHLKRHERTSHEIKVYYKCWYCSQYSNRLDNWRDHLKRHTLKDKQTDRIKFFPEAVKRHEEEMYRVKESRKSKSKLPPGIIFVREGDADFEQVNASLRQ